MTEIHENVEGRAMHITIKVRKLLWERDMTIQELVGKLGKNKRYYYSRFTNDSFSLEDLKEIAEALNCDFDVVFTLKDTGKQI